MHHQALETARRVANQILREKTPDWNPDAVCESVLLRADRVVGQQFVCGRWKVHWYAGKSQLQVFDGDQEPRWIDCANPTAEQKAA